MKTTMKAAILLLSGAIFFSQASLAGPPTGQCSFTADVASACNSLINDAYEELLAYGPAMSPKNFIGLTCKLALAGEKMDQGKAEDAYTKLFDSAAKVRKLAARKIDSELAPGDPEDLAVTIDSAATCAFDVAYN
jgi:hypothetical protein